MLRRIWIGASDVRGERSVGRIGGVFAGCSPLFAIVRTVRVLMSRRLYIQPDRPVTQSRTARTDGRAAPEHKMTAHTPARRPAAEQRTGAQDESYTDMYRLMGATAIGHGTTVGG